jgi:hypothetical protein
MPYFCFRIRPDRTMTLLETYPKFKEAMDYCRDLRRQQAADDPDQIRMMFAATAKDAKRLLGERRPPTPLEEWEA